MKRLLALLLLCLAPLAALAAPLDEIESYTVTVDMRRDGTADLTYHLDWRVLDDSREGPLEWVKIGIPNRHADGFTALSDTISKIGYLSDGGSYVRLDLDRKYYEGETVALDYALHQSYLYSLEGERLTYAFVPGWFEDIQVKSLTIRWRADQVAAPPENARLTDGYYVYQTALSAGQKARITVTYPASAFEGLSAEETADAAAQQENEEDMIGVAICGAVTVGAMVWALARRRGRNGNGRPGGGYRGGFYGGGGGGGSCACASSCACACACACAGGGRAGCSAKNFYGAKLSLAEAALLTDPRRTSAPLGGPSLPPAYRRRR